MTKLESYEYRDYERFAQDWADDDVASQQIWQLLGQLKDDELLIQLPDWLAEQKVKTLAPPCVCVAGTRIQHILTSGGDFVTDEPVRLPDDDQPQLCSPTTHQSCSLIAS